MRGWQRLASWSVAVATAIVLSGTVLVSTSTASPAVQVPPTPLPPEQCAGDERISFVPADPVAGQEILVTVSSARTHRGAFLIGTAPATPQTPFAGQLGTTWPFIVVPSAGGLHVFRFYVDGLFLCAEASLLVQSAVVASSTPTASTSSSSTSSQSSHDNGNGDDDSNDNGGNGNGNGNGNDDDDPQPVLATIQPTGVCIDQRVTLTGRGFGDSQSQVHGHVTIGGASASRVLQWSDRKIVVLVPRSATVGSDKEIFVSTDGGFSTLKATIFDNC